MRIRSIALAAVCTALGIALVEASEAVSGLAVPYRQPAAVESPAAVEVPSGYTLAEVHRVIGTDSGPVVLVRRRGRDQALPIWVGRAEGRAIARARRGLETPRPMTHDLLATTVAELGARVHHVRVDELRSDGVYVGTVALVGERGAATLDARPSDAIALALRMDAPIYVADRLTGHMLTLDRPER